MNRIAYTIAKTFELISCVVVVCFCVFIVVVFVALLAEIHPAFWLVGVLLLIMAIYYFCTFDDDAWKV